MTRAPARSSQTSGRRRLAWGAAARIAPASAEGFKTNRFVPSEIVTERSVLLRTLRHGIPSSASRAPAALTQMVSL